MAIFTILFGNYNGEFKLICIGKFARRTSVNFTQQYGKNRQRCQQNTFHYAVWQLLVYFNREFPSTILSVYNYKIPSRKIENALIRVVWKVELKYYDTANEGYTSEVFTKY